MAPIAAARAPSRSIEWHKAAPYVIAYKGEIDQRLTGLLPRPVAQCDDPHCGDSTHLREIDEWCADLINVALDSDHVFPRKALARGRRNLCGWNEHVRPYKDECKFWFHAWKAHGQPREGVVFDNMRESKRQYMYAVRRLKRRQRELRARKFAEALASDDSRDFFVEAKKMVPRPATSAMVGGLEAEDEIAELFANKYEALYNSVPSDPEEMRRINREVIASISTAGGGRADISPGDVKRALRKIKSGKNDGKVNFNSNHLMYASSACIS